ncbi:uncharacterized protein LOC122454357 isoform X2 [Cervus canadensis]|uniref:uncharacterized protein LOC122454357 isoform X2 n=1 Tax=Cervus canadensis TaxID=1574408 RepID=UPI001C9E83FE|nr:uncharacterized protein LOC122454357 isoform X2 [Cervus canadensis]
MSWTRLQPALSRALLNVELAKPLPSQSLLSVAASFPELGSVVSFQKLGGTEEQRSGSVKPDHGLLFSFVFSFVSSKTIQALRSPRDSSAGGQLSGVRRHAQVAPSLGTRLGPRSSPAQGSAGGYRGWRLQLRALLTPWGQLEVPSARGADLGRFIFLSGCRVSSSALAGPASVQTFRQLQVSLAGAGPHSARPGPPLARCEVGGAPALSPARRGSAAGQRAGPRAARVPPRLRWLLACGFPAHRGAGMVEAWPPCCRQVVRRGRGPRGPWGSPGILLCTLLATLNSASREDSSETGIFFSSLPPSPSGLFLAPSSAELQHLGAGKGGQRLRTLPGSCRAC